jgi:putative endonuclease
VVYRVYVIQNREGKFYIGLSDDVDGDHSAQCRCLQMDPCERTLDIDMAKRRLVAFGSAKIGKTFEATKRRPRIFSSYRSAALVRLIIPPLRRDRWFKSSPRNQFLSTAVAYRVYVIQNREGKFYIGLSDDIDRRITQHNAGVSKWTRAKGPWTLIWQSDDLSLSEARRLEKRLKRQKGGRGLFHLTGVRRSSGS